MTFHGKMKQAVPGRDHIVRLRERPGANVPGGKSSIRISLPCQRDHFLGNVQPGAMKPPTHKTLQKPPFTAATDIQCLATLLDKGQRALQCSKAIGGILHLFKPPGSQCIVIASGFLWLHRDKRYGAEEDSPGLCRASMARFRNATSSSGKGGGSVASNRTCSGCSRMAPPKSLAASNALSN